MGPRRSPEVTYEVVEGRAMLVDPDGAEIITLNPVGTLVWEALDGERDVAGLTAHLLPRLDGVTDDQLRKDIAEFIGELDAAGLIIGAEP